MSLNELIRSLLLVLLLASTVAGRGAIAQEAVRVAGTGAGSLLMQRLLEGYVKARPGAQISVVMPPMGSGGSMRALAAGSVQVAVISSSSMPEAAAAKITPWVRTPLVFTGQNLVTGTQISLEKVAELYAGRVDQWPDGKPVRVVMRSERESDTKLLRALSPAIDSAVTLAQKRIGAPSAGTDIENLQLLERTPGSFGVVSLGQLMLSQSPLRPASLDGVIASTDNLARGTYRFEKPHYLATAQTPTAATLDFVKYVRSPEAMEWLGNLAFIPLKN